MNLNNLILISLDSLIALHMQKYIIPTRFQFYYEDFDTIPKYYSHKIPIESI